MEYWDENKDDGVGGTRPVKGNDVGPYVVPCGEGGPTDPVNVNQKAMNKVDDEISTISSNEAVTLHDAATANETGIEITCTGYKTLVIEVVGTSTSKTLTFQSTGESGVYVAHEGFKKRSPSTATFASTTTGGTDTTPEVWEFDIAGLKQFKAPLTIANGNATVKGSLIA